MRPMHDDLSAECGRAPTPEDPWLVYIVECRDGSLYTGVTNDMTRRLSEHNAGTGSRYTRSRRPVILRYSESCDTRSQALIRECALRLLTRGEKETLISRREPRD